MVSCLSVRTTPSHAHSPSPKVRVVHSDLWRTACSLFFPSFGPPSCLWNELSRLWTGYTLLNFNCDNPWTELGCTSHAHQTNSPHIMNSMPWINHKDCWTVVFSWKEHSNDSQDTAIELADIVQRSPSARTEKKREAWLDHPRNSSLRSPSWERKLGDLN